MLFSRETPGSVDSPLIPCPHFAGLKRGLSVDHWQHVILSWCTCSNRHIMAGEHHDG
jgi:hypothetical protein